MVDDPIFSEPATPPSGDATPTPAAPSNGGDPTATPNVTLEQATEMVRQGVEQATQPLLERLEALNQPAPAPPPAATPEPTPPGDFLTEFSQSPEQAVDARVDARLKALGPVLQNIVTGGHGAFVDIEAQLVDGQFGEGAWQEHFQKPLTKIWDAYRANNPVALSDRATIQREVNGLKGQLFDQLVEFKQKSAETRAAAANENLKSLTDGVVGAVVERTNLTGGIRRMDPGEPTAAEIDRVKPYLAERISAIGGEESPKEFLKRTDYGNTLEDYRKKQAELKKEGN